MIESLKEGSAESDVAERVINFIDVSVSQLLKVDSSIDPEKRRDLLLKDACSVLATFNSKTAQIVAAEIKSDFKRSLALMDVIKDKIDKGDIKGATYIAEQAGYNRDILLKFICEYNKK